MNEIKSKNITDKNNIIEELDKHFNDLNEVYNGQRFQIEIYILIDR